jgi:hypothetical protein
VIWSPLSNQLSYSSRWKIAVVRTMVRQWQLQIWAGEEMLPIWTTPGSLGPTCLRYQLRNESRPILSAVSLSAKEKEPGVAGRSWFASLMLPAGTGPDSRSHNHVRAGRQTATVANPAGRYDLSVIRALMN